MLRDLVNAWSPKAGVVVPDAFVRGVYECTSCGRCSVVCHVDIDYLAHNEAMRKWLARSGCGPMKDHEVLVRSLANSYVHPDVARRTVAVLRALGLDVAYLGAEEPCCGSTATRLGLEGPFTDLAGDVVSRIRASGASTVVTACPGCSSAFREYYPEAGFDLGVQVLHLTELLDQEMASGRLKVTKRIPGTYAWYDPCHLGRIDGVFEPPRRVLAACVEEAVELPRNRNESLCCGSGGGLKTAFPDQATSIGGRVVDLAADAGVDTLVTACPWCETNIGDASSATDAGLEVVDLVDIVYRALDLDGGTPDDRPRKRAPGRLSL
jgi:Fe-S oxidoreductase